MNLYSTFKSLSYQDINDFIQNRQEENIYLDFKLINRPDLNTEDRKTLAKAMSGFANSSGGLIIWGIDARPNEDGIDCAIGSKEIHPLSLFISKLNTFTGTSTSPLIEGVEHRAIRRSEQEDKGYVITLIPPIDSGPYMALAKEQRYYKRSGDSFYKMEYFDIEDIFGRRKKPILQLSKNINIASTLTYPQSPYKTYTFLVLISIENIGRGVALYPYVELEVSPPYSFKYHSCGLPPLSNVKPILSFGSDSGTVIHPGTSLLTGHVEVIFSEETPRLDNIEIRYSIAADGLQIKTDQALIIESSDITNKTP
jgi:hypothetical protein